MTPLPLRPPLHLHSPSPQSPLPRPLDPPPLPPSPAASSSLVSPSEPSPLGSQSACDPYRLMSVLSCASMKAASPVFVRLWRPPLVFLRRRVSGQEKLRGMLVCLKAVSGSSLFVCLCVCVCVCVHVGVSSESQSLIQSCTHLFCYACLICACVEGGWNVSRGRTRHTV